MDARTERATDSGGGGTVRSLLDRALGMPDRSDLERHDEEELVSVTPCNRTQNRRRAVGGKLFVTTQRLCFLPHSFDAELKGEATEIPLDEIDRVTTDPPFDDVVDRLRRPLDTLFGGGLRTRLRIATTDGETELFVVSDVHSAIEEIESVR